MTYSIVARCPDTGMLGIGIATCLPGVGRVARFLEPGVGVVASQARLLPAHGTRVLDGLRRGLTPTAALADSLDLDAGAAHRQVGVVAADGTTAAHTGDRCIPFASHVTGDGFTTQANMMVRPGVPEAMAEAFEDARGEHLAMRLLAALDAAESLGGDVRGRQSAALHVRREQVTGDLLIDGVVDVRVDDDPAPLGPLRRLVGLDLAHQEGSVAAESVEEGDLGAAEEHFRAATRLAPDDTQIAFWHAVTLAGAGHAAEAAAAWQVLAASGEPAPWLQLLERMLHEDLVPPAAGSLLTGH